ncbi:hypothetical protein [Pseudorhodoplanes sp.]|uniref:hypothetical protein n=1 Tax=Pseudorhodoplanes sp. TaxID=1934341 RepID=UPI003D1043EA
MKLIRYIIPTLLLALTAAFSPASALPSSAAKNLDYTTDSAVVLAQYKHYRNDRHRNVRRHHYRPGGRYHSAPHGWRRYGSRPRDWQTRGCVIVGPVWFCP